MPHRTGALLGPGRAVRRRPVTFGTASQRVNRCREGLWGKSTERINRVDVILPARPQTNSDVSRPVGHVVFSALVFARVARRLARRVCRWRLRLSDQFARCEERHGRRASSTTRSRRRSTLLMRAQLLPPRSPEATGMIASLGKTQTPALAATSRRSPRRIPRAPSPAAISSRATCAGKPRLGCRARLAAPITASGR